MQPPRQLVPAAQYPYSEQHGDDCGHWLAQPHATDDEFDPVPPPPAGAWATTRWAAGVRARVKDARLERPNGRVGRAERARASEGEAEQGVATRAKGTAASETMPASVGWLSRGAQTRQWCHETRRERDD